MAVTAITKSDLIQNAFTNVYDRLVADVTTVSITGSVTVTVQTYSNSFNDKMLDEKSNYPILIINDPVLTDSSDKTLSKKEEIWAMTTDIYATQKEAASKFLAAIKDSLETYRDDLRTTNMISFNPSSTSNDSFQRGAFMVHVGSVTHDFKFRYTKTKVY